MLPEDKGVDFLWWIPRLSGFGGVQRKEIKDLFASVRDGRLGKELLQAQALKFAALVIEGRLDWYEDHIVVSDWAKMSREQYMGVLMAAQSAGMRVLWSESTPATVKTIQWLEEWSRREHHTTLQERPGPPPNAWGVRTSKDYSLWVMQSLPGVGRELAERIYAEFDGAPIGWTVTEEELCQVRGIGKQKARKLMGALAGSRPSDAPSPAP